MNNGIGGGFSDPQCTTIQGFGEKKQLFLLPSHTIPILGIEGETKKENNDILGGGGVSDPAWGFGLESRPAAIDLPRTTNHNEHCYNVTLLQCYNVTMLQCYDVTMLSKV